LQNEVNSGVGHSLADAIGFVTNDGVYILRRNYSRGRSDYMRQQRLSPDLMQDFRMFGFQARPFARRHDCDGNTRDAR
jgi:hypothetical protein